MSRPLRVLYNGAFYHVMNRGAGRKDIFNRTDDYECFLNVLKEAHEQFGIEVHAYCLMGNHYHLLIKTPRANLSRAMRHINGLYTQRYNRSNKTDGPLFRGRYKAILIDSDSYLLHLSKYIHLNPLKANLISKLEDYPWSSYMAYVGEQSSPSWLLQEEIKGQLTQSLQKIMDYRLFMHDEHLEPALVAFYNKERLSPVLGKESFFEQLKLNQTSQEVPRRERNILKPALATIINEVASEFGVPSNTLTRTQKGRGHKNMPKKIAMYIAQKYGDYQLNEIADVFGLMHYGGVSNAIHSIKGILQNDVICESKINSIINRLDP